MRHGWKTRIEERKYFEEKKELREQETVMRQIAMAQLNRKIDELRRNNEIN